MPLDWAITQNNLGNALKFLGERDGNPKQLEKAVDAYHAALQEQTRDRVPLDWAMTQNNLGNALRTLGEQEGNPQRLEQAVDAFRAALQERTRDRVPLDWAGTQGNLLLVELAFFDLTGDALHLDKAEAYGQAARDVFSKTGADHYLQLTDQLMGGIAKRRQDVAG